MLVLTMRRLAATGIGGSGSFLALRDTVACVDEMGVEHIGGTWTVGNEGEHGIVFIANLLTTSFFIDCIGLGTVRNDGLALFIKG